MTNNFISLEKCPLCESENFKDYLNFEEEKAYFVRCQNCSLVFLDPQPSPEFLSKHYDKDYVYGSEDEINTKLAKFFHDELKSNLQLAEMKMDKIEEYVGINRGRILDIGCGISLFLKEAQMRGWQIFGIEPSRPVVRFVKERLSINITCRTFPDKSLPDSFFDVVTLWEVLEHLSGPVNVLREAYRILRPGGFLFLTTPNVRSLVAIILDRQWKAFSPPLHLVLFNYQTLQRIFEQVGFKVLRIKSAFEYLGTGQLFAVAQKV